MVNRDFFLALDELETQKRIKKEIFLKTLETGLAIAYKKHSGESKAVEVRLNPERYTIKIYAYQTVVEEVVDRDTEISLEDARLKNKKVRAGDIISEEISSKEFGRIAAQTAKQIIMQKIREVESDLAYSELSQKEDEIVAGVIRRIDDKNVYVEINKLEAVMMPQDQAHHDKYNVGDRIKVYVKKIKSNTHGPQIVVSRTAAGFVKKMFELEVPEISAGLVTIKAIVREAGYRTKMAVSTDDPAIDPVGACVGNRGMRVNAIVSELGGEKIDIIPWCPDILEFIARSLSPAKVVMVQANDDEKTAKVVVMDDMLSLAIGKDGQNARLAAKLTGWKIDVRPYSAVQMEMQAQNEAEEAANYVEETTELFDASFEDIDDLDNIGELGDLDDNSEEKL